MRQVTGSRHPECALQKKSFFFNFFFELRLSLAVFGLANSGCASAFCSESLQPPAAAGAFAADAAGRATSLCVWHLQEHSSDA